jgi:hypothetical protein
MTIRQTIQSRQDGQHGSCSEAWRRHTEAKTNKRGVKRPVGSPELAKWQDALPSKFLVYSALREDDTEHVSKSRQSNENGEGALCSGTVYVPEQQCSNETTGVKDLFLLCTCEIGDVREHVKDGNDGDGERSSNANGTLRILDLRECVIDVAESNIRPDDLKDGV